MKGIKVRLQHRIIKEELKNSVIEGGNLDNVATFHDFGHISELIQKALDKLSKREKYIIIRRYGLNGYEEGGEEYCGNKQGLREIGNQLGLTKERVRQIQNEALRKLKVRESLEEMMPIRKTNCIFPTPQKVHMTYYTYIRKKRDVGKLTLLKTIKDNNQINVNPKEIADCVNLYEQGYRWKKICRETGLSVMAVRYRLNCAKALLEGIVKWGCVEKYYGL